MSRRTALCHICGVVLPSPEDRNAHRQAVHPGYRTEWRGRKLWVVDPAGNERHVDSKELRRLRAKAATQGADAAPEGDQGEAAGGPPPDDAGVPAPERPAQPRVVQAQRRPDEGTGTIVARATVEDALTRDTLADILQTLAEVLSDWDGAGEAGHLTRIEAMSLARLLYDPTVDAVMRRFHGDVSRFKLALALVIILLGKGRVHAQAYERKRKGLTTPAPVASGPAPETVPFAAEVMAAAGEAAPPPAAGSPPVIMPFSGNGHVGPAPAPGGQPAEDGAWVPLTPAMLAERQRAWLQQNGGQPVGLPPQVRESQIDRIYGEG